MTNGGDVMDCLRPLLRQHRATVMAFDLSNSPSSTSGLWNNFSTQTVFAVKAFFKSIDAGAHWTRLPATISNANFFFVNDIVVTESGKSAGTARLRRDAESVRISQS